MAEGNAEDKAETFSRQLTRRFGPLPNWVAPQLQSASADQLDLWANCVLHAPTLLAKILSAAYLGGRRIELSFSEGVTVV